MTKSRTQIRTVAGCFLLVAASIAATGEAGAISGIDCRTDRRPAERAICSDYELLVLDGKIAIRYQQYMSEGNTVDRLRIRNAQRRFLTNRNSCGFNTDCLRVVMRDRLQTVGIPVGKPGWKYAGKPYDPNDD